jgi:hypothetical protein
MAIRAGRYGAVKLGTVTVSKMAEWSLDGITTDTIESTAFGDSFKQYELGLSDYGTLSFRGHYDPDDITGQQVLESALLNASKITALRLYIDTVSYWTPNITSVAAAGIYVTSMKIALTNAGIGSIDFSGRCTGPMTLV